MLGDQVGCSLALPSCSSSGTHRGRGFSLAYHRELPSGLGECVLGPCFAQFPPGLGVLCMSTNPLRWKEQQRWGTSRPNPAGMPISPKAAW